MADNYVNSNTITVKTDRIAAVHSGYEGYLYLSVLQIKSFKKAGVVDAVLVSPTGILQYGYQGLVARFALFLFEAFSKKHCLQSYC